MGSKVFNTGVFFILGAPHIAILDMLPNGLLGGALMLIGLVLIWLNKQEERRKNNGTSDDSNEHRE